MKIITDFYYKFYQKYYFVLIISGMGSALGVGYQDPNNRQQTQQQQPTEEPPTRGKYYVFSVKSISRIF